MSRRQLLIAGASVTAPLALAACSSGDAEQNAARALRMPGAATSEISTSPLQELVHYATLAASSHNTQCWQFHLAESAITITPDFARRCPAVDPDDHHLFVSLGCATENLVQAALAKGLHADARFDHGSSASSGRIAIRLEATQALVSPLFHAITKRQCTRGDYDGQPLTLTELKLLGASGTGKGVRVRLLTERPAMEGLLEYVVAANTAQMGDPEFVAELKAWIRFSTEEAQRTGDGLFAEVTGNPALPRWLGSRLMDVFLRAKSENARYALQVRNAAGIAVFISERNDAAHWVEAGRCYERFALQATALGIRNSLLNQPVEVGAIRPQFAAWLGLASDERPDMVVRFGRGSAMPWSMRRPVSAVLV